MWEIRLFIKSLGKSSDDHGNDKIAELDRELKKKILSSEDLEEFFYMIVEIIVDNINSIRQ